MISNRFRAVFTVLLAVFFGLNGLIALAFAAEPVQEKRIALVIGNGAYPPDSLATAANDAGLIAQTLQAAGFDVVGARDLDSTTMHATVREFIDKASASGPETVAFFYFAGRGVQFEGQNYLVPVDAKIGRDADIPMEGMRVSDLSKSLAALPLKARILVLDAARVNPYGQAAQPLAGGLALMQPDVGTLIAFNAAPGTVGKDEKGPYGSYATALSEMIKAGGLPLSDVFDRTRLRVADLTRGEQLPWQQSRVDAPFTFLERTVDAPTSEADRFADLKSKPLNDFSVADAYQAALARDTLAAYQEFLAAYPKDPLAKRVRAIVAARREAATWHESAVVDTPDAYWSYLERYPNGPHAYEAHRRLSFYDAAMNPPSQFSELPYDVAPPFADEMFYVERRRYIDFGDPVFDLIAPPILSLLFMSRRPSYFYDMRPPPMPFLLFVLPTPDYYPVPRWVEQPRYIAPPPPSVVNVDIHNTIIVNPATNVPVVTSPTGAVVPLAAPVVVPPASAPAGSAPAPLGQVPGAGGAAASLPAAGTVPALGVALPQAAARKLPAGTQVPVAAPVVSAPSVTAPALTPPTVPALPSVTPLGAAPLGAKPGSALPGVNAPAAVAPAIGAAPPASATPAPAPGVTPTSPLPTAKSPITAAPVLPGQPKPPAVLPLPNAASPALTAPALPRVPKAKLPLPTPVPSPSAPAPTGTVVPALPEAPSVVAPVPAQPGVRAPRGANRPQALPQPSPTAPPATSVAPVPSAPSAPVPAAPIVPTPRQQAPRQVAPPQSAPAPAAPLEQLAPRAPPASSPPPTQAAPPRHVAPPPVAAPLIVRPAPVQPQAPAPFVVPKKPIPCGHPGEPPCQ